MSAAFSSISRFKLVSLFSKSSVVTYPFKSGISFLKTGYYPPSFKDFGCSLVYFRKILMSLICDYNYPI
jgi:hypothetical protein